MSGVQDFSSVHSSPRASKCNGNINLPKPAKALTKKRRANRYKNSPPFVLSLRRARNRASQKACRARKEQRIKDLEQHNDLLKKAYQALYSQYIDLETQQLFNQTANNIYSAAPANVDPSAITIIPTSLEAELQWDQAMWEADEFLAGLVVAQATTPGASNDDADLTLTTTSTYADPTAVGDLTMEPALHVNITELQEHS
ncbi:hypothetical protein GGTG_13483 [Gaeumannomyces tritici R3-111a-1]|uniref:BZIP domain-containing protein n=1 Tax=Gaeumannomyces tritici (strain R3-111a-1) TaxID=644352 RepID=J3PJ01_GAET3|nr:hypothetical protein GGTG_13483 [Gaeumannomyces tritici R3-111a-1]EJT68977.1 hypothetical protein GGTG_13483 [Gaeumannomyces tritici R3-111a-1]